MQSRTQIIITSLVALLSFASSASAQTSDNVPRVIRYDGVMSLDAGPLDEPQAMRFLLYNQDGDLLWDEEYSDEGPSMERDGRSCGIDSCLVPFYRGRFSVMLGTYEDISPVITGDGDVPVPLELGIEIRGADGSWLMLLGRQPLVPVPYALWALEADDFVVVGEMTVTGSINTGGTLVVQSDIADAGAISGATVSAPTVHSTGDIGTSSATVSATGLTGDTIVASGDLVFDSVLQIGGNTVVSISSNEVQITPWNTTTSNYLFFNHPVYIDVTSTSLTNGALQVTGTTDLAADLVWVTDVDDTGTEVARLAHDRPLFLFMYLEMDTWQSDVEERDTGISAADYHCFIAGMAMFGGDLNESNSGNDTQHAFTRIGTGNTWHAYVDWDSHNNPSEDHRTFVWCMQSGLASLPASWF